jgi:CheY-like chemotaxis protein
MSTRLLIVDDHANTRELIKKFLRLPGITFQECSSGEEAVACAREFKPHWVTMDIQMSGLNGFDSTRALKKEHPEARVLIVTAFNEPHFRDLARTSGAVGFILKENILALRLMLEGEARNIQPPLAPPGDLNPANQ